MADPQMLIRVAASLDELKSNMAQARAELGSIKDTSAETSTTLQGMADAAGRMGDALIAAFSVDAVVSFAETILNGAHALEILSLQTGVNVEELQVLTAATQQFGLDQDRLGTLIFQLARRIAGDDQSAATALHTLGLSMSDLRGMDPETLFLTVSKAIGTATGTAKDLAATELFGGRAGKAVIAFSSDVDSSMQRVRDSISVTSEQSVKELAELEKQITLAKTSFMNWVTEAVGPVAQGLNTLTDAADHGASKWDIFKAVLADTGAAMMPSIANTGALTKLLVDAGVGQDAATEAAKRLTQAHKDALPVLDARQKAEAFMNQTRLDAAKPILDWQAEDLQQLKDMGALTAKNAEAIGVNAEQLKRWEEQVKADTEAQKAYTDAVFAYIDLLQNQHTKTLELAGEHEKKWHEDAMKLLAIHNQAVIDGFEQIKAAQQRLMDFEDQGWMNATDFQVKKIWDRAYQEIASFKGTEEERAKFNSAILTLASEQADALYAKDAEYADKTSAKLDQVIQKAAQALGGTITTEYMLPTGVTDRNILDQLAAKKVQQLGLTGVNYQVAYDSYNNPYVYIPGVNSAPPVTRDSGGPVSAGQPYYIGTGAQPEMFVPKTDGYMVPNGAGGTVIQNTFNLTGMPDALVRQVVDTLTRQMRSTRLWPSA